MKYTASTVQRLLDDGQWIPLPVNSLPNVPGDKGREDLLLYGYEDKDPSMEHIYLTRFSAGWEGHRLFLNLIKTSLFNVEECGVLVSNYMSARASSVFACLGLRTRYTFVYRSVSLLICF
jgi:hypothetical protein